MKTQLRADIAVYRFIAEDPAKVAALDAELAALGDRFLTDGAMDWEYLAGDRGTSVISPADQPSRLEPSIRSTSMINATRNGLIRGCR